MLQFAEKAERLTIALLEVTMALRRVRRGPMFVDLEFLPSTVVIPESARLVSAPRSVAVRTDVEDRTSPAGALQGNGRRVAPH